MLSLSQSIEGRLSTWNPTIYTIVTKYMSLMVQSQHARFCVWLANKEWTVDVSAALIRHHFSSLLVGLGIEPGVFLPLFCQSMFVSVSITIIIVIICHCFSLVISFNIVVLEHCKEQLWSLMVLAFPITSYDSAFSAPKSQISSVRC